MDDFPVWPGGGVGRGMPLDSSKQTQNFGIYGVDTDFSQKRRDSTKVTFKDDSRTSQQLPQNFRGQKPEAGGYQYEAIGRRKHGGADNAKEDRRGERGPRRKNNRGRHVPYGDHMPSDNYSSIESIPQHVRGDEGYSRYAGRGRHRADQDEGFYCGRMDDHRDYGGNVPKHGRGRNGRRGGPGRGRGYGLSEKLGPRKMYGNRPEVDSRRVTCYNCKKEGHFSRDCPEKHMDSDVLEIESVRSTGEFTGICYNCREVGHLSRDCQRAAQVKTSKCYNCQKMGHMSRECPKKFAAAVDDTMVAMQAVAPDSIQHENYRSDDFNLLNDGNCGIPGGLDAVHGYSMSNYFDDLMYRNGQLAVATDMTSLFNDLEEFPALTSSNSFLPNNAYGAIGNEIRPLLANVTRAGPDVMEFCALNDPMTEHLVDSGLNEDVGQENDESRHVVNVFVGDAAGEVQEMPGPQSETDNELPLVAAIEEPAEVESAEIDQEPISGLRHELIAVDQFAKKEVLLDMLVRGDKNYRDKAACDCNAKTDSIAVCKCRKSLLVVVDRRITMECSRAMLALYDIDSVIIHGEMNEYDRQWTLDRFNKRMVSVLIMVASQVPQSVPCLEKVDWLLNLDMPSDMNGYSARVDLAYQNGIPLLVTSFYDKLKDTPMAKGLAKMLADAGQTVPEWLLGNGGAALRSFESESESEEED